VIRNFAAVWLIASCFLVGCATRTIYIPHGEPVRLAAPVKHAAVWVRDAQGNWVRGRVTLEEGWYALPDPGHNAETPKR